MNKSRWAFFIALVAGSLVCGLSILRVRAANPTSGSIGPSSSPIGWAGTGAGGTSNGESTCVEGVNCDTFTLTVLPGDWNGKRIEVDMTWLVLANDYDLYIHKGSNSGPVVSSSTHGAPSTSETAFINPTTDGTGVFTVHAVYFTGSAADNYHCEARVVSAPPPPPPAPPLSPNWKINYHGTCCEGNLATSGSNLYVLLPVLVQGNKIEKSTNDGQSWTRVYPPVDASFPYGIEGDMQAFGNDVIFFGTELADAVLAHSDDAGATWRVTQDPVLSAGNDQAWSYLGPFGDLRPGGPLPTDEVYVLAGWFRIGASLVFSFDGGLTYPIQTPLVGDDGSGPDHVVCHQNALDSPASPPADTRVNNPLFARQKAGRHGAWGTDRKFYWSEAATDSNTGASMLYVCSTGNFGATWTGYKHPIPPNPGANFVVSHTAFDNNGTLYVLHGNKLYVSFNQGQSFAFIHTLPRFGNAGRSDSGADQHFAVDCGTIHIGLMEDAGEGRGRVYYLRGSRVDTANPVWDEELVDQVENNRLDFMYIVVDANGVPTISYTTPTKEVTTASRNAPMSIFGGNTCNVAALSAVSRKYHGGVAYDVPLTFSATNPTTEPRSGGTSGDYEVVFNFAGPVGVGGAAVTSGTGAVRNVTVAGTHVIVDLTGVKNAQRITVTLTNVTAGAQTGSVSVRMGVLEGDSNGDSAVNSADISQTKSQSGQRLSQQNFRTDFNTDAAINSADISFAKSRSGTAIPADAAVPPPTTASASSAAKPARAVRMRTPTQERN